MSNNIPNIHEQSAVDAKMLKRKQVALDAPLQVALDASLLKHKQVEVNVPLKIVVTGHVDDGKSTLIGRLLYETDSLPQGKYEELQQLSAKRGMALEWSFVLDAFQAERNQAITIDVSHVCLKTKTRDIVFIDAPGHIEFLKNMVNGAANADCALLLIDATEGVREQTKKHAYLIHFLGIHQVVVLINKMDLVAYSMTRFNDIAIEITRYCKEIGIKSVNIIPISARFGDMLTEPSVNMPWYSDRTLLKVLNALVQTDKSSLEPLRLSVQDVYKFDERRIIAGRIESGSLQIGDTILFSPSNKTAKIQSIECWHASPKFKAISGESIGLTLDKPLFVERGEILSHIENPPILSKIFRATLFWLGVHALEPNKTYKMKLLSAEIKVRVQTIEYSIDTATLEKNQNTQTIEKNGCGEIILQSQTLIALDEYKNLSRSGRFVLIDGYEIVAGGMISMTGFKDERQLNHLNLNNVEHYITSTQRAKRQGHQGGILWFTGLPCAGKSTLAMKIEHILFHKGYQVYTLDGDNIRSGLNANLGFSPEDRSENIRRVGEVANLFADAGFIAIVAFISPYCIDREKVRVMSSKHHFHEIYIKADLETCEQRDPKGLYKKARAGSILEFTGVSAPYEPPNSPELIVDTVTNDIETSAQSIVEYIAQQFSTHMIKEPI